MHPAGLVALVFPAQTIESVFLVHLAGRPQHESIHRPGLVVDGHKLLLGVIAEVHRGSGLGTLHQPSHPTVRELHVVLLVLDCHHIVFPVVAQLAHVAVGLIHPRDPAQRIYLPPLDVARRIPCLHAAAEPVVFPPRLRPVRRAQQHQVARAVVAQHSRVPRRISDCL